MNENIEQARQLPGDLLLHPVRLRVVQALVGTAMTPLQLKEQLGDVPQATLYRHVKLLADGGLLEVVDERQVRGGIERTYRVVASAVSLDGADLADATAEDHFRYFATFVATVLADFATYLEHGGLDLVADRVGYRQVPVWLTDGEFDEMAADLSRAVHRRFGNQPSPQRRRRLISTVVMPGDRS